MIVSVPSSALGREPVTGASRKAMPRSARRSPMSRLAAGETVDMSMARPPSARPSAAPPSPNSTSSTWGASGTIVITVPAAAAASAGEPATVTLSCSAASASAFSAVRFQATTSMPSRARLAAIGAPMMPRPRKAVLCSVLATSATSGGLDPQTVSSVQGARSLRGQLLAVHAVAPALARLAAVGARAARGGGAR